MIENYDRRLLDAGWFEESIPQLQRAFTEFTPRSAYLTESKSIEQANRDTLGGDEQPNIVSFPTRFSPEPVKGIDTFENIFKGNSEYDLLLSKFRAVEEYAATQIDSAKVTFLTFSTTVTNARIGVKHLHPPMNGDKCNVLTFGIPLYINPECKERPAFWYTSQSELFPPRYYVDYKRIKNADYDYACFKLPADGKILSLRFDGARSPHYIDYTDHVYVWFVFDGVEFKQQPFSGKQWMAELI